MANISADIVADIVGNFYEAAYDEGRWQHAVESLRQVWDGAAACILLQNVKTCGGTAVHTGSDESYHRSYFEEYARHNLIANAMVPAPAGTIFTNWNPVRGRATSGSTAGSGMNGWRRKICTTCWVRRSSSSTM